MAIQKKYTVYGIKNCDTVQKVLHHLNDLNILYDFIDFKKAPPTDEQLNLWRKTFGDQWVNIKGPTYRKIKEAFESASESKQVKLLQENSSAIKRPIVMLGNDVLMNGYDQEKLKNLLK